MPYQIKNGIIYSGNAVTLTQAEYDALTEAEKKNGTVYYISDSSAVMDASDVGIDGGGNLQDLVGSVATIETSPATAIHAVGDYIVYNGQLYEVTAAIAVGETFTAGTNVEATTVGDQLSELNSGLTVQFPSTGWATTETVNGTTYYTQTISVTSVSGKPIVGITPISGTLPTSAEQDAYDSVEYFTADESTNTIKAYATNAPSDTFAVVVKGAK